MSDRQNPPRKHHYIPVFYLSRWATGKDHQLCQYSKPYNRVIPNRKHPDGTGYLDRLYELEGLEETLAQQVEREFFRPVDSGAADALALMESEGNQARWDSRRRSAWSQFLHSMLLRTPEDIAELKRSWRELMFRDSDGEWERRYEQIRQPHHPPTFRELVATISPESHNRSAINTLIGMIGSREIGETLNNVPWWVIETDPNDYPLLTSDRPIIRTNGLMARNGHLALPIGPNRVFVAAKDEATLKLIRSANVRQLVREMNRQVCAYAVKYVYGIDDAQLPFVSKHFATKHQPRLLSPSAKKLDEIESNMVEILKSSKKI